VGLDHGKSSDTLKQCRDTLIGDHDLDLECKEAIIGLFMNGSGEIGSGLIDGLKFISPRRSLSSLRKTGRNLFRFCPLCALSVLCGKAAQGRVLTKERAVVLALEA